MSVDSKVTGFHFKVESKEHTIKKKVTVSLNSPHTQICMFNFPFKITHFKYSLALLNFKEVCLEITLFPSTVSLAQQYH